MSAAPCVARNPAVANAIAFAPRNEIAHQAFDLAR
jgi:hypothetical protein